MGQGSHPGPQITEYPLMGRLAVRKLQTEDLAEAYRLGGRIYPSQNAIPPWEPEAIADVLCSDPGLSFVCLERKKIRGFLMAESRAADGGARIVWICAENDSADIKDNLLLAFYREAVLRDISLITALVRSDRPGDAVYFRDKGFTEIQTNTVMRRVLADDPHRTGTGGHQ